jgi:hypothetical protein
VILRPRRRQDSAGATGARSRAVGRMCLGGCPPHQHRPCRYRCNRTAHAGNIFEFFALVGCVRVRQ